MAVSLMEEHLLNVVSNLTFDRRPPSSDVSSVFDSLYPATVQAHLPTAQAPLHG
jgi:hypothetical protein